MTYCKHMKVRENADGYARLAAQFRASVPARRLEEVARGLRRPGTRAGITDAFIVESRRSRG